MRTADQIEEMNAQKELSKSAEETAEKRQRLPNGCDPFEIGKNTQFKPGNSGGPGRPKNDIAEQIAIMALEMCPAEVAQAMAKQMLKGNAYTFKEMAERGCGKLKERKEITHIYEETADADLNRRCAELLADLGLAGQIDEIGRVEGHQGRTEKTNGKAQDTHILS